MRIEVAGIPAPQGSKRHVGGGRMVEVSRAVGPWREAVRAETQRAMATGETQMPPWPGPVSVKILFRLRKPKAGVPKSAVWSAKRPDLDKLVRSVLDGLVAGGAMIDDGQVAELTAYKMYATDQNPAGCVIYLGATE